MGVPLLRCVGCGLLFSRANLASGKCGACLLKPLPMKPPGGRLAMSATPPDNETTAERDARRNRIYPEVRADLIGTIQSAIDRREHPKALSRLALALADAEFEARNAAETAPDDARRKLFEAMFDKLTDLRSVVVLEGGR